MRSIKIDVTGSLANVTECGMVVSGTVGLPVEFSFDDAWAGLNKTAVFRTNGKTMDVLNVTSFATVPWELLKTPGCRLWVGVFGTNSDGSLQIPTVWADLGVIQPGADPSGDESADPSLPVWEQAQKDTVKYTPQSPTPEEQAQARENIGAAHLTGYGLNIYAKDSDAGVVLEPYNEKTDTGYVKSIYLRLFGFSGDEPVRLGGLVPGTDDDNAATVGQLNELAESLPIKYMPEGTYCLSNLVSGLYYFVGMSRYRFVPDGPIAGNCSNSFMSIRQLNNITAVIDFNAVQLEEPSIQISTIDSSGDYPNIYTERIKLKELVELFDRVENTENTLGDVETALEHIIRIQNDLVGYFTFYFSSTKCVAVNGMTWEEWCNSEWNIINASIGSYDTGNGVLEDVVLDSAGDAIIDKKGNVQGTTSKLVADMVYGSL